MVNVNRRSECDWNTTHLENEKREKISALLTANVIEFSLCRLHFHFPLGSSCGQNTIEENECWIEDGSYSSQYVEERKIEQKIEKQK